MSDDIDKLAYLGPGYPLFFLFSKYAIAILCAFLLVPGIYELYSNYTGTACLDDDYADSECYNNIYLYLSLANKKNNGDAMNIQLWLNFALVPVLIIIIQVMRRHVRKMASDCDERDTSAADYTVMIEHIPILRESGLDYKKELKELIEKEAPFYLAGKEIKFEVCKINLTYDLAELYRY